MAVDYLSFQDFNIINHMERDIERLNEKMNFVFVPLGLSEQELKSMSQFKIDLSGEYSCFGDVERILVELPPFLHKVGNNAEHEVQSVAQIIHKVASDVIKASHKETGWVCVRAFTPTEAYDLPRWHMDGYYYSPYSGFALKFATVFKGNSTLFHQLSEDSRKVFNANWEDREYKSSLLSNRLIESPGYGEGVFFLVGDGEIAAAHSEPKIDSERLFISVVPGDKNEIDELKTRWGK